MRHFLLICALVALVSGCTSESDARRALEPMGFTQVEVTGYDFFGCSEDDFFHTEFRAKNQNGQIVEGTVCSGLFFKGSTVRW